MGKAEPRLVLQTHIGEMTRDELELFIEQIRARRVAALIEYNRGVNAKLTHESDKIQRKMEQQYTMLRKELDRLDKADVAVANRVATIELLWQELGTVAELLEDDDD